MSICRVRPVTPRARRPWFELALDDGTVARWHGADGPSACREFVARYGGPAVVGWREVRSHLQGPRWPAYRVK